jgi:4-carboxymuconolactone decarboxylase
MTDKTARERGMETMADVYAWGQVPDVPGEFFKITAEHLFAEVWNREGLTVRERRLMLLGVIAALGETAVLPVQVDAALARDELTPDQLREVAVFLAHYVGWPRAASFNNVVEERIRNHKGKGSQQDFPGPGSKRG